MNIADKFSFVATMSKKEAMMTRTFLMKIQVNEEDELPLKETVASVAKILDFPIDDVVAFRRKLSSKYALLNSQKKQANKYWLSISEQGEDLWEWLTEDDEGMTWGTEDHVPMKRPVTAGKKAWDLGDHGVLIDRTLPRDVWRQLTEQTKARGWITALVPNDGAVAHAVLNPETGRKGVLIPTLTSREIENGEDD